MEFNTVDGFQGREVDILILSTVRASDDGAKESGMRSGSIGFVADVRRMNVALTRARLSLWIVGNAKTLQRKVNWAALLNNAEERDLVISVAKPYESMFRKRSSSFQNPKSNNQDRCSARMSPMEMKNLEMAARMKNTQIFGQTRNITKDFREGGRKNIDVKGGLGRQRHRSDPRPVDENNEVLVEQKDDRSSKDMDSTTHTRNQRSLKSKSKVDDQGSGAESMSRRACNTSDGLRSERNSVSELAQSGMRKHDELSSIAGHGMHEAGTVGQVSSLSGKAKDLTGTRKRQRDAVEALLPSALISSKRIETSSKSTSLKRSVSPATSGVVMKPPKPRKGK